MKKLRKPNRILRNPIAFAIEGVRKISDEHRNNIENIIDTAWSNFQSGDKCSLSWADLAFASNIAEQLSEIGICSDDASKAKTWAAQSLLANWAKFVKDWTILVITEDDKSIMDEAIFIWFVQLKFVSTSEFEKSRQLVLVRAQQAKSGNISPTTEVIDLLIREITEN